MSVRQRLSLWMLGIAVFVLWSVAMMVAWSAPVIVVLGTVKDSNGTPQDGWSVTVRNTTNNKEGSWVTSDGGLYQVTFLDLSNNAASAGDILRITATGPGTQSVTEQHTITTSEITSVQVTVDLTVGAAVQPPTLASIDPQTVTKSTSLRPFTLVGTRFETGAVAVVNGVEIPLTIGSATTATGQIPVSIPVGVYDVTVRNANGQSATRQLALTIRAPKAPEDITGDDVINLTDLVFVATNFGRTGVGLAGDVNGDGVINIIDIVSIARRFGEVLTSAAPSIVALPVGGEVVARGTTTVSGDTFSLELGLDAARELDVAGYDVELVFDPTQLRLRSIEDGTLLDVDGRAFAFHSTPEEIASGRVLLAAVVLNDEAASDGATSGHLGRLEWDVIGNRAAATRSVRVIGGNLADRAATMKRLAARPIQWDVRLTSDARTMAGRNYPNPFNPETWIPYQLADDADVSVSIYDASGQVVRRLELGRQTTGGYVTRSRAAHWDGKNALGETVASGLYFYEFRADGYSQTGRMLILK
ncbi:MAG: T9SS type A sorting domain-containing protein [Candidatus Poribacteria bacterium]|nr:T9SS type A sorting domain-containing protein [Candidatus Poribacteria bacterium]